MKSVNRYLRDADSIVRNIQKTVLYNWFQQVWNEGKFEAIGDFLSEDLTGDFTLESYRSFFKNLSSQFKDIHVTVIDVISQDDMECAIVDVKATHIETDKQVAYSGISTIRIENGKAVETTNVFDSLKMYQQLGYELTKKKN